MTKADGSDRWNKWFEDLDTEIEEDDYTPGFGHDPLRDKKVSPILQHKRRSVPIPIKDLPNTTAGKDTSIQTKIFSREYDLPLRTDLVSANSNHVRTHLNGIQGDQALQLNVIQSSPPRWRLNGQKIHHEEMTNVVNRLDVLVRRTLHQQEVFAHDIGLVTDEFLTHISQCRPMQTERGQMYLKILQKLVEDKETEAKEQFNRAVGYKCQSVVKSGAINNEENWESELNEYAKDYLKENSIEGSFQSMKINAFRIFINQWKEKWKPEKDDVQVDKLLDQHLAKLQSLLETDLSTTKIEREQMNLIGSLLLRVEIFCRCAQLGLDLFKSSNDILQKIEKHTVVSISTATGSGKSSLVPALLAAAGYDKILVTQPRRLACTSISTRVNTTIGQISGWAVAGARSKNNQTTSIIYLTDGLLKELLQYSEDKLIEDFASVAQATVFFIDEVHERSINIDLCLGLLARLLRYDLQDKIKILLSSATLDESVERLFSKSTNYFPLKLQSNVRHEIKTHPYSNENMFELIERLLKKCRKNEQILCFVKSNTDVTQSITLLKTLKNINAFPLVESQSPILQQKLVAEETIFFSTTVAQTSLTFPRLKYVIDTGMINVSIYDPYTDTTVLEGVPASQATLKQRKGRLGRTQSGEYFPFYDSNTRRAHFPTPQICQSELSDVDFSLRKSPVKQDLFHFQQWLPNQPEKVIINRANEKLKDLDLINDRGLFTKKGGEIARLPDFGTLSLTTSVYAALTKYKCGRDLILIASLLSTLNTTVIFSKLPTRYHRLTEGDYMSLLTLMYDLVNHKTTIHSPDMTEIQHHLRRALCRLRSIESSINREKVWQKESQVFNGQWNVIAQAFLDGYWENVYVSLGELQGKSRQYDRYNISAEHVDHRKQIAILDKSTTIDYNSCPLLLFAKDIRCSTAVRSTCVLSFLGIVKPEWLHGTVERPLNVTAREMEVFRSLQKQTGNERVKYTINDDQILIKGYGSDVLHAEQNIREHLVKAHEFVFPDAEDFKRHSKLKANMMIVLRDLSLFHPMLWRWKNEKQATIKLEKHSPSSLKVTAQCRDKDYRQIHAEFQSFVYWLSQCDSMQQKNSMIKPKLLTSQDPDVQRRINRVTNTTLTWADLKQTLSGNDRESRMDVVAWIAIGNYDCLLQGSYVRDRIVANRIQRPKHRNPRMWLTFNQQTGLPQTVADLIPGNIDCHLSSKNYFDVQRFLDDMHRYEFKVEVFRNHWRYVLLFDRNLPTGPFTINLIEPHVALTHNHLEFDGNSLYAELEKAK